MTDSGLTPLTRHSQLPIAVVLGTHEIASALVVTLTAMSHLRYRAEDPTSEERYPNQIRPNQFGRWRCKVRLAGPARHAPSRIWSAGASSQQLQELVMIHRMRKHSEVVGQRHVLRLLAQRRRAILQGYDIEAAFVGAAHG